MKPLELIYEEMINKHMEEPKIEDKNGTSIALNNFVKRQTKESPYSYFDGSDEELINIVKQNFSKKIETGRQGIYEVPVPTNKFYSSIIIVDGGTSLQASFKARRKDENPYIQVFSPTGQKSPAKFVKIILYSHDSLSKDGENTTDAQYEIVSINAGFDDKEPPTPMAMARNQAKGMQGYEDQSIGGTVAQYNSEDFVKSILYWSNKVMAG